MSPPSISHILSFSILSKTPKTFAIRYTTASSSETFFIHLQKNGGNIERSLDAVKVKLDSACVEDVLSKASKCFPNLSQLGIRFFIWAGVQSNYRHRSYMYGRACDLFKIKRNPRVILDVIESYGVEGCVVNVKSFKVVLNLCKEAKLADEALWVLRKMPQFNIRADTTAYNVVIRLFCEKGDMNMAEKLVAEMGLIDLYADMITNISMVKGFCNVGRLEDARELFKIMRGYGCAPNAVLYSVLLDGVCRFGTMERALELLEEMEKEGGDCSPTVVTYTSVIQGFCDKDRTVEALEILDRMVAHGCSPNRVTVSTLMSSLCARQHLEEAYMLVDRVVALGVSYGDCYSSLVVSLIRIKKLNEAEKLFAKMLAGGVKPDSVACSMVIRELLLEGRVMDGFCLHEEVEKMGYLCSIDSDIYSVLLVGLVEQSHLVEAAKLARLMLEKGIALKGPFLDKAVEHLKKSGDEELVTNLCSLRR